MHILREESNNLLDRMVEEIRLEQKKNKGIKGLLEYRRLVEIRGKSVSNFKVDEKGKKWDSQVEKQLARKGKFKAV